MAGIRRRKDETEEDFLQRRAEWLENSAREREERQASGAEIVEGASRVIEKRANNVKTTGWSEEDKLTVQFGVSALVLLGTRYLTKMTTGEDGLGATDDEADAISGPLARMLLRHLKVAPARRGDVADAISLIAAMAAYALRVHSDLALIKNGPQQRQDARSGPRPVDMGIRTVGAE